RRPIDDAAQHVNPDAPVMITEFGGIAYAAEGTWGYATVSEPEEFREKVGGLFAALNDSPTLAGHCYTQLTDTLQEANGLATADLVPKLEAAVLRPMITGRGRDELCRRPVGSALVAPARRAVAARADATVVDTEVGPDGDRVTDTPGLGEWQISPRTNWYWALADLDSAGSWPVHRGEVPEAPLALGRATVLHAQGCEVPQWRRDGASAAQPPLSPVTDRSQRSGVSAIAVKSYSFAGTPWRSAPASSRWRQVKGSPRAESMTGPSMSWKCTCGSEELPEFPHRPIT